MTLTHLSDARTAGAPDPAEVITTTLNGVTFRAGRRTAAHLAWTNEIVTKAGGGGPLRILQPCYNTGVAASAGTHDGDGVVDVEMVDADWDTAQTGLRQLGWAAWHRTPAEGFSPHIHMVSIGCPGPVGIYVPGQVSDYYAHRSGLVGHVADPSWHPADIDSTVFDYPAWLKGQDDMNDADWKRLDTLLDAKLAANNTTLVKAVWDAAIDKAGTAARAALRKASGAKS